jgi:hypothetical protein
MESFPRLFVRSEHGTEWCRVRYSKKAEEDATILLNKKRRHLLPSLLSNEPDTGEISGDTSDTGTGHNS